MYANQSSPLIFATAVHLYFVIVACFQAFQFVITCFLFYVSLFNPLRKDVPLRAALCIKSNVVTIRMDFRAVAYPENGFETDSFLTWK